MAAGHDLYAMEEVLIPAKGETLVDTGLSVGLPSGTYARIASRTGLTNKKRIKFGGGVIDADSTGEVKVILMNHGTQDCLIQAGERIAQIIVEKINTEAAVQMEHLANTVPGTKGVGSTDLNPRRTIKSNQTIPQISFLHANYKENEYFDNTDLSRHLRAQRSKLMMTNTVVTKVDMGKYNADFIDKVHEASKQDQDWQVRKTQLRELEQPHLQLPNQWQMINELIHYKNRLYIPHNEELQTQITKGCHDSQIAEHFRQEKTIEIVYLDFYCKGLTAWINDYVRSCDECQHNKSP